MIYVLYYFVGCLALLAAYMFGVWEERKYGSAAAQKELDKQVSEYYTEKEAWDAVESAALVLDHEPASKRIKNYGHLRLVK